MIFDQINAKILAYLRRGKNLLAFSHGTDSTALFWLLQDAGVAFDLAMIDYNVRAQSKDEVASAKALAAQFGKQIFLRSTHLGGSNFENNARAVRYEFFAEICAKYGYKNVILAHQLDDRLEWFLMQLGRGAGLNEMLGMKEFESRTDFTLVRPLLNVSKAQILAFLRARDVKFFYDESNGDESYKRNFIRANFSEPFLAQFASGVAKSFELLECDRAMLEPKITQLSQKFYTVKNDTNVMRGIDRVAKILGVVLSKAQKDETKRCLQNGSECVLAGKIALGAWRDEILLTPYIIKFDKNVSLEKPIDLSPKFLTKQSEEVKNLASQNAQTISCLNAGKTQKFSNDFKRSKVKNASQAQNLHHTKETLGKTNLKKVQTKQQIQTKDQSLQKMDKNFKEKCRILGLPSKIRPYLYSVNFNLAKLTQR